jgi:hypothetical protein
MGEVISQGFKLLHIPCYLYAVLNHEIPDVDICVWRGLVLNSWQCKKMHDWKISKVTVDEKPNLIIGDNTGLSVSVVHFFGKHALHHLLWTHTHKHTLTIDTTLLFWGIFVCTTLKINPTDPLMLDTLDHHQTQDNHPNSLCVSAVRKNVHVIF